LIYKIIIALAGLFGIFRLFRISDNFARTIVGGQIIAIGLTFIPVNTAVTIGFVLFIVTAMLAIVYGLFKKGFGINKKVFILLISIPVFVAHIFALNHWPYTGIIGWTMLIPIFTYLILTLTNIKRYKNELGFLTILAVDAAIKLSMTIEWINN